MKIRTDFVTNSSSSSFVAAAIQNKTLSDIIAKYKDTIISFSEPGNEQFDVHVNDDKFKLGSCGECVEGYLPEGDDIIEAIIGILGMSELDDCYDEDDDYYVARKPLLDEIEKNAENIKKDMKFAKFVVGTMGWGEFAESEDEEDFEDFEESCSCEEYVFKNGKSKTREFKDDGSYYDELMGYFKDDWNREFE